MLEGTCRTVNPWSGYMTQTGTDARVRLDRHRVLETALDLIDREGLGALTMRRLGTELRVDPMTIHHHVENKERLLDGIAELLWDEIALPEKSDGSNGALRRLAGTIRALFRRHPEAAPLILRCSKLPLRELQVYRAYIDVLKASGVREPAAVLRPILFYALGTGYAEVSMFGLQYEQNASAPPSERELLLYLGQALPPGTPPELASAAAEMIADCDADRCFDEGLELMLAGLAAS